MYRHGKLLGLFVAAAVTAAAPAKAELEIFRKDGWSFSTNGRANGFYSYEWGDFKPQGGTPKADGSHDLVSTAYQAAADDTTPTSKFTVSRVHTGFVGSILGFSVGKEITPTLRVTGHVELWWSIETDQFKGYSSMHVDPRESYMKLQGGFGSLIAGRALGFHNRGATMTDFLYANGYSIGSPCNATQQGPLCGSIGYGYQFPGYNAFIGYETPNLSGFKLIAGIFDPARIGFGGIELRRVPLPRVEGEATYDYAAPSGNFKLALYGNGMWQQAGDDVNGVAKKVQAYGYGLGARIEAVKLVKLGVGWDQDVGGGDFSPLVDVVPIDGAGELRHTDGLLADVMVSPGPVDIAVGYGQTRIRETVDDVNQDRSVIKTKQGYHLTLNYHIDPVVFNAQIFRAHHTYWKGEKQDFNYLHAGMTFVW